MREKRGSPLRGEDGGVVKGRTCYQQEKSPKCYRQGNPIIKIPKTREDEIFIERVR